jgi:hypothetical protein
LLLVNFKYVVAEIVLAVRPPVNCVAPPPPVNVPVPPPPVLKPVTLNVPPVLFVKVAVFECVPPVTRMSAVIVN